MGLKGFVVVVVVSLIKKDKFLQALGILRQLKSLGLKLSKGALSTIVQEFNKKKEIGDMMNFLEEWRCVPELRPESLHLRAQILVLIRHGCSSKDWRP